ncbi:MerR family transcriptional regulator [Lacrimispora sp. 210928-DFI.3.58]|uniref:MerR family transcriptional regulator n=1 Tax=Lacrimispora sp. 210928-DFI.3.58 TaxID=2883214 RepID=UPI001D0606F2|nr:MerR family transcriptional regulator [Lacrimispora sp. 210928-DFI.3.58]MCB7321160.1 MerR family transcriptional regulator [Lacrimispora sp. 210928-DFI.3.58]
MRTISQVAELTGSSIRTLQYYDEIGLLKPSELTPSGYRLYNDAALQKLQQILFFKELGFKLKDIREILEKPDFDRIAAFKQQKELLLLKRNRTDRLIQLLSRLEKGEQCMSFKEFDLSDYINALEAFKSNQTEEVIRHWGSVENFDLFIQKIKDDEPEVAKLAIKQFGSVEKYTEAMKYNLEHFSEIMEIQLSEEVKEISKQSEILYGKLIADLSENVSSAKIQSIVQEIWQFIQKNSTGVSLGKPYMNMLIDAYSNDYIKSITDSKYKKGASDYITKAFRHYLETHALENS